MATINKYVDTDLGSDSGGQGGSSGSGAYATLNYALAQNEQDLTDAGGDILIINCAGAVVDSTNVAATSIDGYTTSSTSYLEVKGNNTSGKYDSSKYHFTGTINVRVGYMRFTDIQMGTNGITYTSTGNVVSIISRSVFYGGAVVQFQNGTVYILNTLIYDTNNGVAFYNAYGTAGYAYNCTFIGSSNRVVRTSGSVTVVKNCVVVGTFNENFYADGGGAFTGSNYNTSSDATTSGGANDQASVTPTFVDSGNKDYHLASNDTIAKGQGVITSGESDPLNFTDDIDGNIRTTSWDIGCDEFYARLYKTVKPSGGDYTNLETCMNANEQNLVVNGYYFDVEIDGDWSGGPDAIITVIENYTTDDSHYINIYTTSQARHTGVWDSSKYVLGNYKSISITDNHVRIAGLQIHSQNAANNFAIDVTSGVSGSASDIRISNNIIKCEGSSGTYNRGLRLGGGKNIYVYNNIIYGFNYSSGYGLEQTAGTAVVYIYNNTVYDCSQGMAGLDSTCLCKNNLVQAGFDGYYFANGNWRGGSDYNISNKAGDIPGGQTHSYNNVTATYINTTPGSEDLHLHSSDTVAKDKGVSDPGSGLFLDDIDGVLREGTWDIGADEYTTGGVNANVNLSTNNLSSSIINNRTRGNHIPFNASSTLSYT